MGNMLKGSGGKVQPAPQQGVAYSPAYGQPAQYRPPAVQMQQQQVPYGYRPPMSGYPASPSRSYSYNQNQSSPEDMYISNLSGLPPTDVGRLRLEFYHYTNPYGVIDREGFRKLYIASLLNMTWQAIEHDSEIAFRNFDVNGTGTLDFTEYITACSRMMAGNHQPSTYPSYQY